MTIIPDVLYYYIVHILYIYYIIPDVVYMYIYYIFCIHCSVNAQLGFFHILATVSSAAVNIGVLHLFKLWFSPDILIVVGLHYHVVALCLIF